MLAFVAPPLAPYIPPLRLPPLRGPVTSPYRPPVTNRPPGTQPAPIYQPPDLLPPTGLDLKGEVCVFANTPIWEPKKIRYKYPGEAWQEIAGDRYTLNIEQLPPSYFSDWLIYDIFYIMRNSSLQVFKVVFPETIERKTRLRELGLTYKVGTRWGANPTYTFVFMKDWSDGVTAVGIGSFGVDPALANSYDNEILQVNWKVKDLNTGEDIPPTNQCIFRVFDIFNNVILSITRDECPEVIIVPERCYFKPENERLVAKVIQSFLDPPLRIEYQGNCVTVWKDSWPINFSWMIYKECTDNPNCPPPRIRLDNKRCKEECRQCPIGTAIKVLLGGDIACVDAFGCIIKSIKFKPGCNNYDCICG